MHDAQPCSLPRLHALDGATVHDEMVLCFLVQLIHDDRFDFDTNDPLLTPANRSDVLSERHFVTPFSLTLHELIGAPFCCQVEGLPRILFGSGLQTEVVERFSTLMLN